MSEHAKYCLSGDNTLKAIKEAIKNVVADKGDDYFVLVLSDGEYLSNYSKS